MNLSQLGIKGRHFIDNYGRIVILRGVNLAGISVPFKPDGATHIKENWPPTDLTNVSWIGRPFPLEESEEHYKRLKAWGFNCLRFLTSWEAIEHEGPYKYDTEYLDYLTELIRRAADYGLYVFINLHQDVWSRVCGGDGHPLWLFDKADAAITMQYLWNSDPKINEYKTMAWGSNSLLFPARTMWTLFWAGKDFAPELRVRDEESGELINIEIYLQKHFTKALEQILERIKDMPHVFGINPINEPSKGYIGVPVGRRILKYDKNKGEENPIPGIAWSPLDNMAAAAGFPREIEELGIGIRGLKPKRKVLVNPKKIKLWKDNSEDFWASHGVWGEKNGEPIALKEDYFKIVKNRKVNFTKDYLVPFHDRMTKIFRNYNKNWLLLIENDPEINGSIRYGPWPKSMPENIVNAFHWYDLIQLGTKRFLWPINIDLSRIRLVFGYKGIQKMYIRQMEKHLELSLEINGGECPSLVGEFGIAMDMTKGKTFKKWRKKGYKAFKKHDTILNLMYNALDHLMLSSTQWNYASFNNNKFGDLWNQEDLSIFSSDQMSAQDMYSGARGIGGFCRPFASKIAGMPLIVKFDRKSKEFQLKFKTDNSIKEKTEIFVPKYQYPEGFIVECAGADVEQFPEKQRVYIHSPNEEIITFTLKDKILS